MTFAIFVEPLYPIQRHRSMVSARWEGRECVVGLRPAQGLLGIEPARIIKEGDESTQFRLELVKN